MFLYWDGEYVRDKAFYEIVGYFRTNFIGTNQRSDLNRTMSLIDAEISRAAVDYPDMLCVTNRRQKAGFP